jgi:hypothetical protein
MKRSNLLRVILSLFVLFMGSLACDAPGSSDDEDSLGATATMRALATMVAAAEKGESEAEDPASDSAEPEDEEEGVPSEPSATPTITTTPTLGAPMVSVSVDTNCRFGPGEVYEYKGALLVGEQAGVAGKLDDESFWYIENPDAPPPYCWIWGAYASVTGDASGIPILTPPPTPTATPEPLSFVASEYTILHCVNHAFVTKVANTGDVSIESYSISVEHPDEGVTIANTQDHFANDPVCGYTYANNVPVGGIEFIVTSGFTVPSGTYKVTLKVCSEDGLGGTCKNTYFEVSII